MRMTPRRALITLSATALVGVSLTACSGSSSTSESSTSAAPVASSAAVTAVTYCEPLQAAYDIKPSSGSVASDEDLAAFAAALEPAAVAAQADGRQDLYDLFALVAQFNAAPDSMTDEQANTAFTQIAELAPGVLEDCGIDLMS